MSRPSVREHRDALLEAVERFALHVDQRVVLALERQPLCLVDEQVGHAAVGPLLGHDVQHAAVGQVPPVFLRGGLAVAGKHLRLPLGVVDDLRQPPELAQAVEHGAVRGPGLEPLWIELPQRGVGLVEEDELLLAVEDGDGGGDAVERAVVGGDLAVEIALRLLDRSHVDRGRSGRVLVGDDGHVVQPALAADDERNAAAIALPAREHARGGAALALLEKLDLALLHLRAAVRLHGLHVGVVHPGEAPVLSAQPHGHR